MCPSECWYGTPPSGADLSPGDLGRAVVNNPGYLAGYGVQSGMSLAQANSAIENHFNPGQQTSLFSSLFESSIAAIASAFPWQGVGKFLLDDVKGAAGMVIGTPFLLGRGLWRIGRGIVTGEDFSSIREGLLDIAGAPIPKYGAFTGISWPGTVGLFPISWVVSNSLDAGASQWHDGQVLSRSSAQFGWINRAWTGEDGRAGVGDLAIGPYGQAVRAVGTVGFGAIGLVQLGLEALP